MCGTCHTHPILFVLNVARQQYQIWRSSSRNFICHPHDSNLHECWPECVTPESGIYCIYIYMCVCVCMYVCICVYVCMYVRGCAGKSLARPTSRCRRTELIVSLERGVGSCAELQVFSCYRGWKEACQATRAISTTWRRELSSSFISCKARRRRKFTPFWQKHWGKMHHLMPPSKTGWPSLNVVIFPLVMRLVMDDRKQWPPRRLLTKFTS